MEEKFIQFLQGQGFSAEQAATALADLKNLAATRAVAELLGKVPEEVKSALAQTLGGGLSQDSPAVIASLLAKHCTQEEIAEHMKKHLGEVVSEYMAAVDKKTGH